MNSIATFKVVHTYFEEGWQSLSLVYAARLGRL